VDVLRRYRERRFDRTGVQLLRDRVARQPGAPVDLADRLLVTQRHPMDDIKNSHMDHSVAPLAVGVGGGSNRSILNGNLRLTGSVLRGKQQIAISSAKKSRLLLAIGTR